MPVPPRCRGKSGGKKTIGTPETIGCREYSRKFATFSQDASGYVFASSTVRRMTFEVILGRGMACCLHPTAAWRVMTPSGRALVVGAYASAGFIVTLAGLFLL